MDKSKQNEIFLTFNLEQNAVYKSTLIVGGTVLKKIEKNEESGLIKIKIDEQVFHQLLKKKRKGETTRNAIERAILTMTI